VRTAALWFVTVAAVGSLSISTAAYWSQSRTLQAALAQQKTAYTLYRNSPMFKDRQRIYVASFDAADEEEFDRSNCQITAQLNTEHNSAPFPPRFWCERGRFRPGTALKHRRGAARGRCDGATAA
jgi:hypothetical protein